MAAELHAKLRAWRQEYIDGAKKAPAPAAAENSVTMAAAAAVTITVTLERGAPAASAGLGLVLDGRGLPPCAEVWIDAVAPGGLASAHGLGTGRHGGARILAINGQDVASLTSAAMAAALAVPSVRLELRLRRPGSDPWEVGGVQKPTVVATAAAVGSEVGSEGAAGGKLAADEAVVTAELAAAADAPVGAPAARAAHESPQKARLGNLRRFAAARKAAAAPPLPRPLQQSSSKSQQQAPLPPPEQHQQGGLAGVGGSEGDAGLAKRRREAAARRLRHASRADTAAADAVAQGGALLAFSFRRRGAEAVGILLHAPRPGTVAIADIIAGSASSRAELGSVPVGTGLAVAWEPFLRRGDELLGIGRERVTGRPLKQVHAVLCRAGRADAGGLVQLEVLRRAEPLSPPTPLGAEPSLSYREAAWMDGEGKLGGGGAAGVGLRRGVGLGAARLKVKSAMKLRRMSSMPVVMTSPTNGGGAVAAANEGGEQGGAAARGGAERAAPLAAPLQIETAASASAAGTAWAAGGKGAGAAAVSPSQRQSSLRGQSPKQPRRFSAFGSLRAAREALAASDESKARREVALRGSGKAKMASAEAAAAAAAVAAEQEDRRKHGAMHIRGVHTRGASSDLTAVAAAAARGAIEDAAAAAAAAGAAGAAGATGAAGGAGGAVRGRRGTMEMQYAMFLHTEKQSARLDGQATLAVDSAAAAAAAAPAAPAARANRGPKPDLGGGRSCMAPEELEQRPVRRSSVFLQQQLVAATAAGGGGGAGLPAQQPTSEMMAELQAFDALIRGGVRVVKHGRRGRPVRG